MPRPRHQDVPPLSAELRAVLLDGPYVLGKTLWDIPSHDELRLLWTIYGDELVASRPRREPPWFVLRDAFVNEVRGRR